MAPVPVLHVEVVQRLQSSLTRQDVLNLLHSDGQPAFPLIPGTIVHSFSSPLLKEHVDFVRICDVKVAPGKDFDVKDSRVRYHIYQLDPSGPEVEQLDHRDEEVPAAIQWVLPSADLEGLWESLVYEDYIKENLLSFMETMLVFSDCHVNEHIVSCNRLVLLHGPPGTGKTTLCKALAQKIAIRTNRRFTHGLLFEINSHSLFSKWFSESGKLVLKMFTKLQEFIDDPGTLVCVLVDEVESLTHARKAFCGGNEPSDSIRVVNAVLNHLDRIRRYPNVLILTTSNITKAIDNAFIDRADIKQFIGLPTQNVIYEIYRSCLEELQRAGIIFSTDKIYDVPSLTGVSERESPYSYELLKVSRESVGLSGRTIRKIPFLAHAYFVEGDNTSLEDFIGAMLYAVRKHVHDNVKMKENAK